MVGIDEPEPLHTLNETTGKQDNTSSNATDLQRTLNGSARLFKPIVLVDASGTTVINGEI